MNIKKHIPNAITCCNLLCGCLAIVQAFEGNLVYAAYLVGLAAIFDFFDGFAARMLKVSSAIGKDLDSLADMVTFGVVPGVVMFQLIQLSMKNYHEFSHGDELPLFYEYLKYSAFIIPIFSALRLAKFNNDTRQTESFIGLNTPANAMFICSMSIIFMNDYFNIYDFDSCLCVGFYPEFLNFVFNSYVLCILSLILSLLLVSEIPMFSLKFKHFKWKGNEIRFVFLALSVLMLVTLQFVGVPLIIILYVLLSLLTNYLANRKINPE